MRSRLFVGLVSVAALACHTITEELPTRSTPVNPVPIVAPLPQPAAPVPAPLPTTNPNPAPAPPAPAPQATPRPQPPPPPSGGGDGGGDFPNNNAPVTKVGAKVYFIECGGQQVPGSEGASSTGVGCRVHMDATPKDAHNKPTRAKGTPRWSYSDTSLVKVGGNSPYNPVLTTLRAGSLSMYCELDGVRSNTVNLRIR
jgi:hypothetical protein